MSSIQVNERWELSEKKKRRSADYIKKRIELAVCENGVIPILEKRAVKEKSIFDLYSVSLAALL